MNKKFDCNVVNEPVKWHYNTKLLTLFDCFLKWVFHVDLNVLNCSLVYRLCDILRRLYKNRTNVLIHIKDRRILWSLPFNCILYNNYHICLVRERKEEKKSQKPYFENILYIDTWTIQFHMSLSHMKFYQMVTHTLTR